MSTSMNTMTSLASGWIPVTVTATLIAPVAATSPITTCVTSGAPAESPTGSPKVCDPARAPA